MSVNTLTIASQIVNSGRTIGKEVLAIPYYRIAENLKYMRHRSQLRGDDIAWMIKGNGEFIPYQAEGDPQTQGSIAARTLTTYHADLFQKFDPEAIYGTIHDVPLSSSKITMPIVREIVIEDIRNAASSLNAAIWTGVRNASGTNSLANCNGFDTIIANEKAAETPTITLALGNYMQLGQITPYNAGDKLELLWNMASPLLRGDDQKHLIMFMPESVRQMYIKWYNNNYATAQYTKTYDQVWLHCAFGRCELACPPGTSGLTHIILTTRDNMRIGTDGIGEGDNATGSFELRTDNNPRLVQMYTDCWLGVNFAAITKEYLMCGSFTSNNGAVYATVDPESITFDDTNANSTDTATFVVKGINLTSSLQVSVNGGDGKVTVDTSTITAAQAMATDGKTVTATFAPTAAGAKSGTIIIASATDDIYLEIPFTGTGK